MPRCVILRVSPPNLFLSVVSSRPCAIPYKSSVNLRYIFLHRSGTQFTAARWRRHETCNYFIPKTETRAVASQINFNFSRNESLLTVSRLTNFSFQRKAIYGKYPGISPLTFTRTEKSNHKTTYIRQKIISRD